MKCQVNAILALILFKKDMIVCNILFALKMLLLLLPNRNKSENVRKRRNRLKVELSLGKKVVFWKGVSIT